MDKSEWPLCNGGEYLHGLTLVTCLAFFGPAEA
jgi:hypothetical protein